MQDELNKLFQQYKLNKTKNPPGPQGIPEPLIEGELDIDNSQTKCCGKCGSLNISTDLSTNLTTCLKCQEINKAKKSNFQKHMELNHEEEIEKIQESKKLGTSFL